MTKATPTIAVTSTLAMIRTARARGAQVDDVLRDAGLSQETLADPDARLPAPTVMAVWNALRERTGDPALQVVAPAALEFGEYRIIDYLVAASATVGDGVRRFAQFFGLIADSLVLQVRETPDDCSVELTTVEGAPVPPVYVDYVFAALVYRIRTRICARLQVRRVELRHAESKVAAPYQEVFQAPISFGANADRLRFSIPVWNLPTDNGDAALVGLLEEHARILSQRTTRATAGFEEEVRRAIATTLTTGASIQQVARALNLSVRSLQRRLDASETTFRDLSEDVRGRLAEGYLANPGVSISEVAVLLGFSEESAFNRAFRRWTGESPGRWRRSAARQIRES